MIEVVVECHRSEDDASVQVETLRTPGVVGVGEEAQHNVIACAITDQVGGVSFGKIDIALPGGLLQSIEAFSE